MRENERHSVSGGRPADRAEPQGRWTNVIRWTARAWAVVSIGLILAFIVGEGFDPSQIEPRQWAGFLFFPLGISVGMILGWWREGLGGSITVASLVAFYLIHLATAGRLPAGWAWLVFAAPGFLFLLAAQRSRGAATLLS